MTKYLLKEATLNKKYVLFQNFIQNKSEIFIHSVFNLLLIEDKAQF